MWLRSSPPNPSHDRSPVSVERAVSALITSERPTALDAARPPIACSADQLRLVSTDVLPTAGRMGRVIPCEPRIAALEPRAHRWLVRSLCVDRRLAITVRRRDRPPHRDASRQAPRSRPSSLGGTRRTSSSILSPTSGSCSSPCWSSSPPPRRGAPPAPREKPYDVSLQAKHRS